MKKNYLLMFALAISVSSIFAAKPNLNGFTCKDFGINGDVNACVGDIKTYEINHNGQKTINWTVTPGLMEIVSISGINIDSYKDALGIPANIGVAQIYVESNYAAIGFSAGFTYKLLTSNGDSVSNDKAGQVYTGGMVDVTQFPLLRGLLSNVQITGNSIVVRNLKLGYGQVVASATDVPGQAAIGGGLFTCYSSVSAQKNIVVNGAEFPSTLAFNSNQDLNNIACNQETNISIPYIQRVGDFTYRWYGSVGATVMNASQTSATFTFNGKGTYTIFFEATDACGSKKVYSKNVTVNYQDSQLRLEGNTITGTEITINCTQAAGFNMSIEPWLSNGAQYQWTLPAGWAISGKTPVQITHVGNIPRYTYKGDNTMRYVRIYKANPNAETGDLSVQITNVCGSNQVTKTIKLITPTNISVQFPTNLVSCESSIDLTPIIADAVAPYKLTWTKSGIEGFFTNGTNYVANTVENTFVAQRFGQGTVTANVEDARGCSNRATANLSLFGGNDPTDMNISGWLSGHINPLQKAEVASNLTKAPDFDRIYFVRNLNGVRQVWFYFFNVDNNKWELKNANITDLLPNGENPLHYVRSGSSNDYLFYVNGAGYLEVALIDRTTGQANGISKDFSSISPRENNNAYSYTIEDINGSLVRVIWKNLFGDLFTQIIVFDLVGTNYEINLETTSYRLIASNNNFTSVVRFDMDKQRNRIFYFRNDGGFYTQRLDNIGVETKINGVLNNDQVWTVTDVVFDNEGNVYFTANGDLFFAAFDLNENHIATYKIETTDGVLTDHLKGDASGYLAINRTTNVLYYAGYNGNIYQAYRDVNFATNKQFHIVRATPSSFYDNVSSSMVFHSPHLFYRSRDNQIHNLFYIDIAQVVSCKPKWIREGDVSETVDARVLESADASTLFGKVYPNPSTGKVTVDVWGSNASGKLEVFNLSGEKLLEAAYNFKAQELDVNALEAGMYIIRITDGEKSVSLKLAKN